MKSQTYTVAATDISNIPFVIDCVIDYVLKGSTGNRIMKLYPTALQIINNTGVDIDITFLSNEEINEFPDANYFSYFLIPNNSILRLSDFSPLPFPAQIIIKQGGVGTATNQLRIDAINFSAI